MSTSSSHNARISVNLKAFGHGKSYTTFDWADLKVSQTSNEVHVEVSVKNTGSRAGREVVQAYVSRGRDEPRKLEAIAKTAELAPGDSATLRITLDSRAFARWIGSSWATSEGSWRVSLCSDVETEKLGLDVSVPQA